MTDPEKRRRRPAVSCALCRTRKIRCNREVPCSNCIRSHKNATCTYGYQDIPLSSNTSRITRPPLAVRRKSSPLAHSDIPPSGESISTDTNNVRSLAVPIVSSDAPTPASMASSREAELIRIKIRELQEQLSKVDSSLVNSPLPQSSFHSSLGGDFHIHEGHPMGKSQGVVRSITHKTRTFGQSHWMNGVALIRDITEISEPYVKQDAYKILTNMKRCKNLARTIKLRRSPSWPLQDRLDIPSRDLADALIDCYLQTIESIYRILHIPTFKRDYAAIWSSPEPLNPVFLIQLKLVLAIGATMHDTAFSLRTSAMQWVYEAQTHISEPRTKSMLGIQYLQIHLLLLIARETTDVSCEMIWISVGSLYRMAIQMGLHRDPALLPKSTTLVAEMRRRLWNSILEMSMQSSLTSGGPPLTSTADFDTLPPGNFDDEDLLTDHPVAKPDDQFTQMSVVIALRRTLPYRLAVIKALNDLGTNNTYETTLQLDTELRQSYRTMRQTIRTCQPTDPSSEFRYSVRSADIIMHHYVSALHTPYFGPAFRETAFAFSRKVVTESSLKAWYAVFPSSYNKLSMSCNDATSSLDQDCLARLMTCGSGFFRVVTFKAAYNLAIELRNQLREEEGMGTVSARPDLLAVLEGAKEWCLNSIKAGETSVKGFVMFSTISAQVDGLIRGVSDEKTAEMLSKAAANAEEICLPILEAAASQLLPGERYRGTNPEPSNMSAEPIENWDIMMSDPMFDGGGIDEMTWDFGDDVIEEPSFW